MKAIVIVLIVQTSMIPLLIGSGYGIHKFLIKTSVENHMSAIKSAAMRARNLIITRFTEPSTVPSTEPSTTPTTESSTTPTTESSTTPTTEHLTTPTTEPSTTPTTEPSTVPSTEPSTTPTTESSTTPTTEHLTTPTTEPSTTPATTEPSTTPATTEPSTKPTAEPATKQYQWVNFTSELVNDSRLVNISGSVQRQYKVARMIYSNGDKIPIDSRINFEKKTIHAVIQTTSKYTIEVIEYRTRCVCYS
ncbi:hypothetical protein PV328_007845 [Microctonus aethiopoides]|uniref:Uncharacterized protein n=1 Tax=Microctonus aethiopoides TaxID=144406 RepID=A0AA39C9L6_9HYME|nr:hypothetical protein PV328_007845 [Microctonus aethiopoides]